jgi:hypothetical protein
MPREPAPVGGGSAAQLRARIAATNRLLQRSRQRATAAIAQVWHVDRLHRRRPLTAVGTAVGSGTGVRLDARVTELAERRPADRR